MRISDWSSDVCSSDLRPVESQWGEGKGRGETLRQNDLKYVACADIILCSGHHLAITARRQHWGHNDIFLFRRSEEHTSELQSLMRISYAVFCLKKKNKSKTHTYNHKQTKVHHTNS